MLLEENEKSDISELSDEALFELSLKQPTFFVHVLDRYQVAFLRKAKTVMKTDEASEDVVQ